MQNDDELRKKMIDKMIDIADEIELGMTIYVHKTSLEWISLPDMDNYLMYTYHAVLNLTR